MRRRIISAIALLFALSLVGPVRAAGRGEPGPVFAAKVFLGDREADLALLNSMDLDIDGVFADWVRVYLVEKERQKLEGLGFQVLPMTVRELHEGRPEIGPRDDGPAGTRMVPAQYHDHSSLTTELNQIALDHPAITRIFNLGSSEQGRELWMMKISANPDTDEDEPGFAYISSMHGDEVVGMEMCVGLINHLTDGYGSDPRVDALVDNTEIWILPSMNPDGTALGQFDFNARYNANGVDLNRDFPDQFVDPVNTAIGRQKETEALMNWGAAETIALSANMHGGALVANYPFDNNPAGSSVFSPAPAPDHGLFVSISRTYADNNPPMSVSNGDSAFDNGITNGAEWYPISGGMQDWAYVWRGAFEITLELSENKWPQATTLPGHWTDNLESLLAYMERVHEGVRGVITDVETGAPVAANVFVDANPFPSPTDPDVGDYHRVMLPGTYSLQISAPGYYPATISAANVSAGPAARYDVALTPRPSDLQHFDDRVEDGGNGWLDLGETADLAVTVYNEGRSTTAVSATLEPTGWYGGVVQSQATFPDVALGTTEESYAPHFGVTLDGATPAGHRVGYALRWSSDQGSGTSEPFFLDAGPQCVTVASTDVPKSILDFQTSTSQLFFGQTLSIASIEVAVDITHTYIGDLTVKLVSPTSTEIVLHNRSGGSSKDIVGTYGDDLTSFQPLTAVAGESSLGNFTLEINDGFGGDTGTLNSWSVEICPEETATPEMRFRDLAKEPGGVSLSWWSYPGLTSYKIYRSTSPSSPGGFVDVTVEDADDTDAAFLDTSGAPLTFWLVTGVGSQGEGPKGHFGQ